MLREFEEIEIARKSWTVEVGDYDWMSSKNLASGQDISNVYFQTWLWRYAVTYIQWQSHPQDPIIYLTI